jgi:hypothetical protein
VGDVCVLFISLFPLFAEDFLPIDGEESFCCQAAMSVYWHEFFSLIHSQEYHNAMLKHKQFGNAVSLDFVDDISVC